MLDRSVAPAALAIDRPLLPIPEDITVGKLPLTILNQGTQPVVLFEMVIPVGRYEEPQPGLAFYVFKMLTEGTSRKTAEEIAETFDFYGSHLEIMPTLDAVSIKLYALRKFFPTVLGLLAELLTESDFPASEFETLRQIRTEQVKQQHARNNAFANLKFREMLFGPSHPYGLVIDEELVQKPTLEEVRAFKGALMTTPQVFMSGWITESEIQTVEQAFGHLHFIPAIAPDQRPITPTKTLSVTREDSTQASLRLGNRSIDRTHPEIHKLKVANELLGGFFGSRLMKNIREEKGLTYGIHSSLMHLQHASYWSISSEILREKTGLAQEEILKEIQTLQNEAPGQGEFEMVINYMKGKFLSSFDSPFSSHEMIKGLRLAGLTEDYFFAFLDTLDTIRPEEISEVTTRYFQEKDLSSLVVL